MKENYFLKYLLIIIIGITSSTLFGQTYTFTNAGATGNLGPTQLQVDAAYGAGVVTINTQGIQEWTVPTTGDYSIEAFGAQGESADPGFSGGLGAQMYGEVFLTAGTVLKIVVGQQGVSDGCSAGGGGGSFITTLANVPYIIAGGGGGTRTSVLQNGCDANIFEFAGTGSGGADTHSCALKTSGLGLGGIVSSSSWGSGGGGFNGSGASDGGGGGISFILGAQGGGGAAQGGFGSGGSGNGGCGGGGGGGYSGGDGGRIAGAGGSYNSGANQVNVAGANSGMGSVVITALSSPIVCGPVNTLYQTIGNAGLGITEIYRYNNFQQSYIKVGQLPGVNNNSAPSSAYNAATQYVYSSIGGSTVRVYNPATNYSYVGDINITGNTENFNNVLFAYGDNVGYVVNNKVIQFKVTGIAAYPATVAVTEVVIPGAQGTNDYSLIGTKIYGVAGTNTLRIIDLVANNVTDRVLSVDNSLDGVAQGSGWGAAWQDRFGNFYAFNNTNGGIYKIPNVVSPTSTTITKILLANPSGQNDGFGCEIGPDPLDWDEDGISNNIDIDDDNDGILDINESGGTGLDPGGNSGGGVYWFRNVTVPGFVDVNSDGINDMFDFDLDGIPDAYDLDSDNDGIPDNIEGQSTFGYITPSGIDGNNDGLDDSYGVLGLTPPNTDGTGNDDFLDVDADDDGLYDTLEAGLMLTGTDSDGDGLDDAIDAAIGLFDPNGTIDNPTLLPNTNAVGDVDYRDAADIDLDGVQDVNDLDDDNDGILDLVEYGAGLTPFGDEDGDGIFNYADAIDNGTGDASATNYTDTNMDGIPDVYDFDLDGIPNHLDTNSDGDGCGDANEAYGINSTDSNNDGTFGAVVGPAEVNPDGTVILAGYPAPANLDSASGNTAFDFLQLSILPTSITLQPIDVTIFTFSNVSFTSTASTSGTGTIEHYQWQEQINGVGPWTDIVDNGTIYNGATTTTLDITVLNNALDGNRYQLVVSSPAYVCDTDIISNAALLTVTQNVIVAVDDNGSANEGTASVAVVNVLANDDLAGATPTTATVILTQVSSTSTEVSLDPLTGEVNVTAAAVPGIYTVVYQICETASPLNCITAEVTVTVADAGNPIAVDDTVSIAEGTTTVTSIDALANDSMVDNATYTIGSLVYASGNGATVTYNALSGEFEYTPAVGFSGLDTFTYTICDNDSPVVSCSTATVTVIVTDEGNPIAVDDSVVIAEGTTTVTSIDALANDNMVDNATYSVGSLVYASGNGATVIYNALSGEFEYTPAVGFSGIDTFTYTICDDDLPVASCSTATVTVIVTDEGNPIAVDDSVMIAEGTTTSTTINVFTNDSLADNATINLGNPVSSQGVTVINNNDGTFSYIPPVGFSGLDTFTYTICDDDLPVASCSTATVTVIVADLGNPIAVDDSVMIAEGTLVSTPINAIANDNMADGATYSIGSLNTTGTTGAVTDNNNGTFGYIPAVGFSGIDTFTYTICDNDLPTATCSTATVTIIVTDEGNPIAVDDSVMIAEGTLVSTPINAIANDNMADGATYSIGSLNTTGTTGAVTDNNNGTFGYIPAVGFSGLDTFTYTICDDDLPVASCSTATVTVIVTDEGSPIAVDDSVTITEDTLAATVINVFTNDSLADNATINSGNPVSSQGVTVINNNDGTFSYIPAAGFAGTDTFTYTICDDDLPVATCSTATVFVTVLDQGDPFAYNDLGTTVMNIPVVTVNVLANDVVVDNATITSFDVSSVNGGTVSDNGGGTFLYTPPTSYFGLDTFTYTICDDDSLVAHCSTATVTILVTPGVANLVTVKTVTPPSDGTYDEGDTFDYTLTVTNIGPNNATGVSLTDLLPAGVSYVSDSGMGTYNSGSGLWTIGNLAVGSTSLTITAKVNAGTSGDTITNFTTAAAGDQSDPTTVGDDLNAAITVANDADIVLTKVVDNATPNVGDIVTYTVTVTNNGPAAITNLVINDALDSGLTFNTVIASSGTWTAPNWTVGSLASGITETITIQAIVGVGTGGQTLTNTVSNTQDQTDSNLTSDDASEDITVTSSDLVTTKTVDNNTPNEGDTIVYTIEVENNGPSDATGVSLTDLLPVGVTYVSHTTSNGIYNQGSGEWKLVGGPIVTNNITNSSFETGDLSGWTVITSGTGLFSVVNVSPAPTSASPTDGSNLLFFNQGGPGDHRLYQDVIVPTNNPTLEFDLGYSNQATGFNANQYIAVNIRDAGNDAILNTLLQTLSGDVQDSSIQGYSFDLSAYAGQTIRLDIITSSIYDFELHTVIDNVRLGSTTASSTLASGETATLEITATVNAGTAGQTITNFTTAATGDQEDLTTVGDDLSEAITVANDSDIVLTKIVDNNSPNEGDTITYTVTVTNNGPAAVTNLVVADALPVGLTFGLVTPSTGTWTAPNWTIGNLASGITETITIKAIVGVGTGGSTLVNTVSNTQNQTDDNTTLDDATESITVTSSDLVTVKTVSNASPNEGDIITYTLTVTNDGPSDATSVNLTDNLPVGVTYVSHSTVDGVFNNGSGIWNIGNLTSTSTATLTINASVDAGTVGQTITNTTSAVTADQSDPNISNNIGSVSIVPVAFIDLSLTKTIVNNITAPLVGDQITFEIRVNNEGPTNASGVQVTDLIPSGYQFVNYSSTIGTYNSITGLWSIGNIEIGNIAVLLVDVKVLESGDYTNCAEVTNANENDVDSTPNSGNDGEDDYACATTIPVNEADLSITKTVVANNVTPLVGTEVTFEIRITNNGPVNATEVEVTDLLPSGYTFVNYSSTIGTYNEVNGLWTVGKIANGETEVLLIDAIVNATGDYMNCTTITNLRQIDPVSSNDSDCASTTPIPVADLELTKDVDNLKPYAETEVEFTIVVTNNGPSDATGVQVTDLLPDGYTFVSSSTTTGTYTAGTGLWNVGTIDNDSSETLTIVAYVLPIGDWTNIAEVTASNELDLDSTPGNNDVYEDDQAQVTTEPIVLLTVPELFTPDGDGTNDTFEIEFLEVLYPNFSMEIVNRYGNKVYEYKHNGNPNTTPMWWDGYSNGRWNFDSLELPVGTYFYTIYFNNDERKPQTGWIYLRR